MNINSFLATFGIASMLAWPVACSTSTFQGSAGKVAKNDGKNDGKPGTTFVPVNGEVTIGSGDCKAKDGSIASCASGVVTGKKVGTTTVSSGGDPNNVVVYDPLNPPPGATAYIPVGATGHIGSEVACTSEDESVATCKDGAIVGVKVGTTTVHASGSGGMRNVVVYDPKNPPPGAPGGTSVAGGGTVGVDSGSAAQALTLTVTIYNGAESLVITNVYQQTASTSNSGGGYTATYKADPAKATVTPSGGFPPDQAGLFAAFPISAVLSVTSGGSKQMTLNMATSGLYAGDTLLPEQTVTSVQTSNDLTWSKDEGQLPALGNSQIGISEGAVCNVTPNGNQPAPGVHAVILTNPAPCDFRLPTVTVSGGVPLADAVPNFVVPIGTYWLTPPPCGEEPGCLAAHSFPLVPRPVGAPGLDNGFLLIQPDGTSYLLVDAGIAYKALPPDILDAETIAGQVSQTLGFGPTALKQPSPGTAAKGFTDSTVFKKGSVIALYDDTADMSGVIDVKALVNSSVNVLDGGLSLKWTGKAASP